ncbi:MAG: hypothetical protein WAW13_00555 [Minisyncoccia bacterium]
MTEYTDIIDRLESATGPDRELDALACRLAAPKDWEKYRNWAAMPSGAPPDIMDRDAVRWVPAYTASLDDSLALVGEKLPGWRWEMAHHPRMTREHRYVFEIEAPSEDSATALAPTPALAVLLALFRALEANQDQDQ